MDLLMRLTAMSLLGYLFAYGESVTQLGLLVMLWMVARQRQKQALYLLVFFAVALSPAALAAFDYSTQLSLAMLAWAVPVAINVITLSWALGMVRYAALCSVLVLTALSLTPLSSIAVISIWPLAGLLFPGTGWFGIALITILVFFLIVRLETVQIALNAAAMTLIAMLALSTNAHAAITQVASSDHTIGIDTYRGMPDDTTQLMFATAWRYEELEEAEKSTGTTVIFPESVFGDWNEQSQTILSSSSRTVIGGAREWIDNRRYINVLVNANDGQVIYRQRFAVPAVLSGATQAVSAKPIEGSSIVALICVELANTGLVARTYAAAPDQVIWVANLGWSQHGTLYNRLVSETVLWSRLFNVNTVMAVNHAEAIDA